MNGKVKNWSILVSHLIPGKDYIIDQLSSHNSIGQATIPLRIASLVPLERTWVKTSLIVGLGGLVPSTSWMSTCPPSSSSSFLPLPYVMRALLVTFFFLLFCMRKVSLTLLPLLEGWSPLSLSSFRSFKNLLVTYIFLVGAIKVIIIDRFISSPSSLHFWLLGLMLAWPWFEIIQP